MDTSTINFSVSPIQMAVAFLFQMWLVVFSVILILKVNRLTKLLEERFGHDEEES